MSDMKGSEREGFPRDGKGVAEAREFGSGVRGTVSDGLRNPRAMDDMAFGKLTVICAEPGMGKTFIANRLIRTAKREGRQVLSCSFEGPLHDQACRKVVRRCRAMRMRLEAARRPLVVIDGVAAPDESEAGREAHAIERLVRDGAEVLVCLRPESEQLAEHLDAARRIGTDDLLFVGDNDPGDILWLTGGIPSLVSAARADAAMGLAKEEPGPRYQAALCEHVDAILRPGLPQEEFRVRLAMVLLGHATLEEVALVAGRCDTEQLTWLERDVRLLGVSAHGGTFCCYGLRFDDVFEGCIGTLQAIAATEPQLVVRACGVLASGGEARRSALAARLCASERDFSTVCITWGVAYVGIGEADLVDEALRVGLQGDAPRHARKSLARAAAAAVLGTAKEVDAAWEELSGVMLGTSADERLHRTVEALGACRDVLRSPRQASKYLVTEPRDTFGLACLDHVRTVRLLAGGHFGEAYALLSNDVGLGDVALLSEAYLCDDLLVALALSGGLPDRKERHLIEQAAAFYAKAGLKTCRCYHDALATLPGVLMADEVDATALVDAAGRAERQGDAFFQALCLTAAAAADLRAHALSRAHVRAEKAADITRALGEAYLLSAAELVDVLALELLGEPGAIARFCDAKGRPHDLALMGSLIARAVGEVPHGEARVDIPVGTPCPKDALWVLNLLVTSCREIGTALVGALPPTWMEMLRAVRSRHERKRRLEEVVDEPEEFKGLTLPATQALRAGEQAQMLEERRASGRVRVSVLGGFRVESDEREVPKGAFERRRARDLLTLLALVPGHRLRRYQAIEALWPEEDYYRGPRRLYEATGEARKRLTEVCSGAGSIVVADKMQGSVGFDISVVSCDVDDFEREARLVLSENGDDFWMLEHARHMARIYRSGPDEHLSVLGSLVAQRTRELRMLYVDAIVAAGEAALRLGKTKLAVRYASDGHQLEFLREDAMILLVRALKAAGRGYEVAELYKAYSQRLIDVEGVPPSLALRRAVEQALGDGPDDYTPCI